MAVAFRRAGAADAAARDGFMIAFLNPKLAVFMLALFAPFTGADQSLAAKAVMVLTIGGIDALWYATVVLVVVRAGLLPALERRAVLIDRLFGPGCCWCWRCLSLSRAVGVLV